MLKGGMMKKLLFALLIGMFFIACDFAKEATELKPDIELTYINPLAWLTFPGDTVYYAEIDEIHFVAVNSVDAKITKMVWEYYDGNDNLYFGPFETAILLKIKGCVSGAGCGDTAKILNIPFPLDTVRSYAFANHIYDARIEMRFIAEDDYGWDKTDTIFGQFGFIITPP